MKTIKYITIIMILSLWSIDSLQAQFNGDFANSGTVKVTEKVKNLDFDVSKWFGPWRATNGDMTYELSLKVDTIRFQGRAYETLVGTLVYKRNGTVVRTITPPDNALYAVVKFNTVRERSLGGFFGDRKENNIEGELYFSLVEGSNNRATWSILPGWNIGGYNSGSFDLPTKLTFNRVVTYTGGRTGEEFTGGTVIIKP